MTSYNPAIPFPHVIKLPKHMRPCDSHRLEKPQMNEMLLCSDARPPFGFLSSRQRKSAAPFSVMTETMAQKSNAPSETRLIMQ